MLHDSFPVTGGCGIKVQQLLAICTLLATPNDEVCTKYEHLYLISNPKCRSLYLIGNPFWNLTATPPVSPILIFFVTTSQAILLKNINLIIETNWELGADSGEGGR